jgi:membrane protein DedA with SNARE-associated domain
VKELWETILGIEAASEEYILLFVESFWLYPGLFFFVLLDAFIPMAPAESVVIASSSAWANGGAGILELSNPFLPAIFVTAAAGAWCGDQVAYFIGSKFDVRKFRMFRNERGIKSIAWAEHALEKRGTTFIIAARHIPMGRITVNLMAGALQYPYRRYMGVDAIAVVIWAAWGVALGTFAGAVFDNLIVSIIVGIAGGIVLGILADKVLSRFGLAPVDLPDLAMEIEALPKRERKVRPKRRKQPRPARVKRKKRRSRSKRAGRR